MQSCAPQVLEYIGVDGKHSEVVVKKGRSQVSFANKEVLYYLYCSSAEATIWTKNLTGELNSAVSGALELAAKSLREAVPLCDIWQPSAFSSWQEYVKP